ncbi:GapS1 family protein [Alteromonas ponticola]|uniref:GapS1 family protein n=1 Tax=Alteromonas ponticola TaxID=2720613 RepID=UPI003CCD2F00
MDFDKRARPIRNKLKRYTTESIVECCLNALHDKSPVEHEGLRRPWIYCLILEWALELINDSGSLHATQRQVICIAQDLWDLSYHAANLTAGTGYRAPLRKMLIPQLKFQTNTNVRAFFLFRFASILLDQMNSAAPANDFEKITGVPLERFFVFATWLQTSFTQMETPFIRYESILIQLTPHFSHDELVKLLRLVGGSISDLAETVKNFRAEKRSIHPSEYFDEPLLINRPVILLPNGISTPHPHVLDIGISEFVLRTLKKADPRRFRDKFTTGFENYIFDVFREHGLDPMREDGIESIYKKCGVTGKVVDFFLNENDSNLFIDAKGVEPKPKVLTTVSGRFIRDQLKDHHFKGIDQIAECIEKLSDLHFDELASYQERFGLIITHQDFYVGDGVDLCSYLEEAHHNNLMSTIDGKFPIENLFFCGAAEFEGILKACSMSGTQITDFLKFCREQQTSAVTRKFDIAQHLVEYCNNYRLGHRRIGSAKTLVVKDRLFNQLISAVMSNKGFWSVGTDARIHQFVQEWRTLKTRLFAK